MQLRFKNGLASILSTFNSTYSKSAIEMRFPTSEAVFLRFLQIRTFFTIPGLFTVLHCES